MRHRWPPQPGRSTCPTARSRTAPGSASRPRRPASARTSAPPQSCGNGPPSERTRSSGRPRTRRPTWPSCRCRDEPSLMATLRAPARADTPDPRPASTAVAYALAGWLGAAAILAGLAGIVAARWLAAVSGFDGLTVGLGFGTALTGLWLVARQPIRATGARHIGTALGIGIAFGLALVLGGALGASLGDHPVVPGLGRPAAQFVPWAAITIVVAAAEEGIL